MKKCYYCNCKLNENNPAIDGFDNDLFVIACSKCAENEKTFIKAKYYKNEIYMQFVIQYLDNNNDPTSIANETIVKKTFNEAYSYANKYYGDKLIGLYFEDYVNKNNVELVYHENHNCWTALDVNF